MPLAADADEVGVSAAGKFRRDAEAAVVFVEVKIHALQIIRAAAAVDQVAEIGVVLHVTAVRDQLRLTKGLRDPGTFGIGGYRITQLAVALQIPIEEHQRHLVLTGG